MKLIADIQFSRELAGFPVGDDSQFHLAQLNGEDQMLCRAFGLHAPGVAPKGCNPVCSGLAMWLPSHPG